MTCRREQRSCRKEKNLDGSIFKTEQTLLVLAWMRAELSKHWLLPRIPHPCRQAWREGSGRRGEFVKHKHESQRRQDREIEARRGPWAKVNLPIHCQVCNHGKSLIQSVTMQTADSMPLSLPCYLAWAPVKCCCSYVWRAASATTSSLAAFSYFLIPSLCQ